MYCTIQREAILKPLQTIARITDATTPTPILAHALVQVRGGKVTLTGTNLQVQFAVTLDAADAEDGELTVPAHKYAQVVAALPAGVNVVLRSDAERAQVRSGRSRFALQTLPAHEYPLAAQADMQVWATAGARALRDAMAATAHAMAKGDVRYYLNGMHLELDGAALRCVASDGHRMAVADVALPKRAARNAAIIVPRDGIKELIALLDGAGEEETVDLEFADNRLRVQRGAVTLGVQLVDGTFPDYRKVLPPAKGTPIKVARKEFATSLDQALILAGERHGVRLKIEGEEVRVETSQEGVADEADIRVSINRTYEAAQRGFNARFLCDAVAAMQGEDLDLYLGEAEASPVLIRDPADATTQFVVMPMRI